MTTDPAYSSTQHTTTRSAVRVDLHRARSGGNPFKLTGRASRPLTGADNRSYNVDTYIVAVTTPGAAKKVTLVVHNADNTKTFIRETSTFTPPTGCNNGTYGPVSAGC